MTQEERQAIREIAMNVFSDKIEPFRRELEGLGTRLRSLYSNGSGGPQGFLENARAQDLERWESLEDSIKPVLRYVADRQVLDEAEKSALKKRTEQRKIWIPIAAAVILGLLTWIIPKLWSVGVFLWDDYLKAHPQSSLHQLSQMGDRASASTAVLPQF
jgi:hypothetical protein